MSIAGVLGPRTWDSLLSQPAQRTTYTEPFTRERRDSEIDGWGEMLRRAGQAFSPDKIRSVSREIERYDSDGERVHGRIDSGRAPIREGRGVRLSDEQERLREFDERDDSEWIDPFATDESLTSPPEVNDPGDYIDPFAEEGYGPPDPGYINDPGDFIDPWATTDEETD